MQYYNPSTVVVTVSTFVFSPIPLHCMLQCNIYFHSKLKVKVAHIRLPSVGFRSWSRILAVSLQVMWVINPAVGCHYFPTGLQLPPQPLRGLLPIFAVWWTEAQWVWAVCLRLLPDSIATAIWNRALLRLSNHANHSATEPPHCKLRHLILVTS